MSSGKGMKVVKMDGDKMPLQEESTSSWRKAITIPIDEN